MATHFERQLEELHVQIRQWEVRKGYFTFEHEVLLPPFEKCVAIINQTLLYIVLCSCLWHENRVSVSLNSTKLLPEGRTLFYQKFESPVAYYA